jgi:hypothetical protein
MSVAVTHFRIYFPSKIHTSCVKGGILPLHVVFSSDMNQRLGPLVFRGGYACDLKCRCIGGQSSEGEIGTLIEVGVPGEKYL